MSTQKRRGLVVVITDGVGMAPPNAGNAVRLAKTPTFDLHWGNDPFAPHYYGPGFASVRLIAHGTHVGLPQGVMGNSEVGHSTIFCGKPYPELLDAITMALDDRSLYQSSAWKGMMQRSNGTTHFIGVLSDGKVHSDIAHLLAMMQECAKQGIKKLRIWALTDGRDVKPASAEIYTSIVEEQCARINREHDADFRIAMVAGRGGTLMDRGETNWKIVERAWNALFFREGKLSNDASTAITEMRKELAGQNFTDENLGLRLIPEASGEAPRVENGDNLVLFNYRTDRAVEFCSWMLGQKLTAKATEHGVTRKDSPEDVMFVTMSDFDPKLLPLKHYFLPRIDINTTLVQFLGNNGMKVFSASEPSKFPHVTEFPNARSKERPDFWTWQRVDSDQEAPFNRLPWMQSVNIALAAGKAMKTGEYDLLIINFPSPDMVGHETNLNAVISAVEAADYGMAEILRVAKETGYTVVYGGDHGNAERMYVYENGEVEMKDGDVVWHTAHTSNPVRWVIVDPNGETPKFDESVHEASLSNISATIANLLGFTKLPDHWRPSLLAK